MIEVVNALNSVHHRENHPSLIPSPLPPFLFALGDGVRTLLRLGVSLSIFFTFSSSL
jgi:hypothetical protein